MVFQWKLIGFCVSYRVTLVHLNDRPRQSRHILHAAQAAKFIIFNTNFLFFNAKFLVFNTKFITFTHPGQLSGSFASHASIE